MPTDTPVVAIEFPLAWEILQTAELARPEVVAVLTGAVEPLGAEVADAVGRYFDQIAAVWTAVGIDAIAVLAVSEHGSDAAVTSMRDEVGITDEVDIPDEVETPDDNEIPDVAIAFAAVGRRSVPVGRDPLDVAWELAAADVGRGTVLERDTEFVERPSGPPLVRSSCLRHAVEYADESGVAPYVRTVRFTYRLSADHIGFLHFDTPTVVYQDELAALFDAIAGTIEVEESIRAAEPG